MKQALRALAWLGVAILYYTIFSYLFDTPAEYALRHSTDKLRQEYEVLNERYDSLMVVVENVVERDRDVFAMLFESEPYNFESDYNRQRAALYESLLAQSSGQITRTLDASLAGLEAKLKGVERSYGSLSGWLARSEAMRNRIPSIQPVINHELTLLTAPYGALMHPFYRTMQAHQGVDYTIPEGSRVFATADGVVQEVRGETSTSGVTVVIDHRNGYTTSYSHLKSAKVESGEAVRRGDIIALSGNTGLSLAPHLHYEVRYNGVRVNPIHYFFMELTADEYQRIVRIAQSGMQSFD